MVSVRSKIHLLDHSKSILRNDSERKQHSCKIIYRRVDHWEKKACFQKDGFRPFLRGRRHLESQKFRYAGKQRFCSRHTLVIATGRSSRLNRDCRSCFAFSILFYFFRVAMPCFSLIPHTGFVNYVAGDEGKRKRSIKGGRAIDAVSVWRSVRYVGAVFCTPFVCVIPLYDVFGRLMTRV